MRETSSGGRARMQRHALPPQALWLPAAIVTLVGAAAHAAPTTGHGGAPAAFASSLPCRGGVRRSSPGLAPGRALEMRTWRLQARRRLWEGVAPAEGRRGGALPTAAAGRQHVARSRLSLALSASSPNDAPAGAPASDGDGGAATYAASAYDDDDEYYPASSLTSSLSSASAAAVPATAPSGRLQGSKSLREFVASVFLGLGAAGTVLLAILLRARPLGQRAALSVAPLAGTLLPYLLCLTGGLPCVGIGSWRSVASVGHRLGGIGSLVLPLVLVLHEALTGLATPAPLYALTVTTIAGNLLFGMALIPSRFPAYDIPAARGLAVGTLYGWAFLGWSLTFRLGAAPWYGPIGRLFALVALYGVAFSWSDALQNLRCWRRGVYKRELGRKWYLPFEPSTYKQVFFHNIYRQPTPEAMKASLMTAWQGALPTIFVAVFGSAALLQLAYLAWGPASIQQLAAAHPHLARWAASQALLAVAANNFATFLVSLVVHNRMPMAQVAFYNFLVPLIPLLNVAAFCLRYPGTTLPAIARAILAPPLPPTAGATAAAAAAAAVAAKVAKGTAGGVP